MVYTLMKIDKKIDTVILLPRTQYRKHDAMVDVDLLSNFHPVILPLNSDLSILTQCSL